MENQNQTQDKQEKQAKQDKPKTVKEEQDEIFAEADKEVKEYLKKLDKIIDED